MHILDAIARIVPISSSYSDYSAIVILITSALSIFIGRNITRESLRGIDSIFAVLGFLFGLFMMVINFFYVSNVLLLLSPLIVISCTLYLRYRNEFRESPSSSLLEINHRHSMILSIIWWSLTTAALITYYLSEIYTRHPLFFIFISGAVAVLGVQIISFRGSNRTKVFIYIVKILMISIIFRASAYYISPYPVGSDPWGHREYISYFLDYGRVAVPQDFPIYYLNYPVAHLHAAFTSLLTSISSHDALFLLGVILAISTIVTFLIGLMLTGNVRLALISMLLLNFTDAHIQWSIQVIAMSFGIAIYAFIIFFALRIYSKPEERLKYIPFMLTFLGIIVWVHTIAAFITLLSLFLLIMGYILYDVVYNKNILSFRSENAQLLVGPSLFLIIVALSHWMDPSYPFFDMTLDKLFKSLSMEAQFIGATTLSNVHGRWEELLETAGFCLYAFFGFIGALYCLSHKEQAKKYFTVIILVLVLFIARYIFPIFGMSNIIPSRWPAFAFSCFALFVGFGIFCALRLFKTKRNILCMAAILLFIGSFFMITNDLANNDSPLYGEKVSPKLIWTESEMNMFYWINYSYDDKIITDEHTQQRPFNTYLKNQKAKTYRLLPDGKIDTDFLSKGLIIWREDSLNRPVIFSGGKRFTTLLLDEKFFAYLDHNYECISDVGTAKSYLSA